MDPERAHGLEFELRMYLRGDQCRQEARFGIDDLRLETDRVASGWPQAVVAGIDYRRV